MANGVVGSLRTCDELTRSLEVTGIDQDLARTAGRAYLPNRCREVGLPLHGLDAFSRKQPADHLRLELVRDYGQAHEFIRRDHEG